MVECRSLKVFVGGGAESSQFDREAGSPRGRKLVTACRSLYPSQKQDLGLPQMLWYLSSVSRPRGTPSVFGGIRGAQRSTLPGNSCHRGDSGGWDGESGGGRPTA